MPQYSSIVVLRNKEKSYVNYAKTGENQLKLTQNSLKVNAKKIISKK